MQAFWFLFYNIFIVPLEYVGFHIAGIFNDKVRRGIRGRQKIMPEVENFCETKSGKDRVFIIHCASLGEYEMAKPVMEKIKKKHPDIIIVLTFFSPSGYEQVHLTAPADLVTYLPFDSVRSLAKFFRVLKPEKLILTSYEAWPNLIWTASRLHIEIDIISARMQANTVKNYPVIRSFYSAIYTEVNCIYPITEEDKSRYQKYFLRNGSVTVSVFGNTRYDRVIERSRNAQDLNILPSHFSEGTVFAGGSIWPEDNQVILKPLAKLADEHPELKFIFAPHETDNKHVNEFVDWCHSQGFPYALFSELAKSHESFRVIIVDVIGHLAELYHECDIAFVGGAFSGSVHNVMEPAVSRCTVLYGTDYHNSDEAEQLVANGGGFSIRYSEEFEQKMQKLLTDKHFLESAQERAAEVILRNAGATDKTVSAIFGET